MNSRAAKHPVHGVTTDDNFRSCSVGINRFNRNRFGLIRLTFLNKTLFQPFSAATQQLLGIFFTRATISRHYHANAFSTVSTWFEVGWKSWSTKPAENGFPPIEHEETQPTQPQTVDPSRTRPTTYKCIFDKISSVWLYCMNEQGKAQKTFPTGYAKTYTTQIFINVWLTAVQKMNGILNSLVQEEIKV